MNPTKPKISTSVTMKFEDLEDETTVRCAKFDTNPKKGFTLREFTFEECIFENVSFQDTFFIRFDFVDVIFKNCDLSNMKLEERFLNRVIFEECKMNGTNFIDATLKDVGHFSRYEN